MEEITNLLKKSFTQVKEFFSNEEKESGSPPIDRKQALARLNITEEHIRFLATYYTPITKGNFKVIPPDSQENEKEEEKETNNKSNYKSKHSKVDKFLHQIKKKDAFYKDQKKYKKYRKEGDGWLNTLYLYTQLENLVNNKTPMTKDQSVRFAWQLLCIFRKRTN